VPVRIERIAEAKRLIQGLPANAPRTVRVKAAEDVLNEFMMVFAGMAAARQPLPPGVQPGPGQEPNEEKFVLYGKLAADIATVLIGYQKPRLKAVFVATAPPLPAVPANEGNVAKLPLRDAVGAARLYRELVQGRKTG
jgi:hypothetical protein